MTTHRNTRGLRRGGPGRKKGVPNTATIEARVFCRRLVADPVYVGRFSRAFVARRLHRQLEAMVWAYAFGRPSHVIDVEMHGATLEELLCKVPRVDTPIGERTVRPWEPDVPSGACGGPSEASMARGPLAVAAESRGGHDEPLPPVTASTRGDEQETEAFDPRPFLGPPAAPASTGASTGALDVLGGGTDRSLREQLRERFPYLRRS